METSLAAQWRYLCKYLCFRSGLQITEKMLRRGREEGKIQAAMFPLQWLFTESSLHK